MTTFRAGKHERVSPAAASRPRFSAEVRDAVAPRTVAMVVGVLLLQLGCVLSYVGAFHHPTPHRIAVDVVAPAQVSGQLVRGLNGIAHEPLRARAAVDESAARRRLRQGQTGGVLLVSPAGTTDQLVVASGAGSSRATAVEQVVTRAQASQQRTVTVTDVVPLQRGDARGLTGFYLVVGWTVGGYLVASLLGVARGARPVNGRRALIRLLSVVPYAVLSGIGGALIVGPVLGALRGHEVALAALGALLVFAAAAVTMAFQVLFGVLGIGITVLLFVVLGNPSAGGAYAPELLPAFWRVIGGWIPNGAGTSAVRRIVYLGGHGVGRDVLVIAAYALVGAAVALALSVVRGDQRVRTLDLTRREALADAPR